MKTYCRCLGVNLSVVVSLFCINVSIAQIADSAYLEFDKDTIQEIVVSAYPAKHSLFRIPSSVSVIDAKQLSMRQNNSLVASMNSVPGVRMEERSPGSYRLSIRGSLLRSPFGVRNVKVYLDEFPLTNAGGDTYLNLLDKYCVGRIEVLKGPDGSLFGANSSGIVRIAPVIYSDSSLVEVNGEGGSFNTWRLQAESQAVIKKNTIALTMAWQMSEGYRDNSALERKYFQLANRWKYRSSSQLRVLSFYSDLHYKTPGGLTLEQFEADPSAARYPTAALPGAEEQKAGVRNKTFYQGISNDIKITGYLRHVLSLFGSYTDFQNPFITNYETRGELSFGLRTWLEGIYEFEKMNLRLNAGSEFQQTQTKISNHENNSGTKGVLQVSDNLKARNSFIFFQATTELLNALIVEGALSLNLNGLFYSNIYPVQRPEQKASFKPSSMPRFAMSYVLKNRMTWRFTISKGYSLPTLSEIRSSDNTINTTLQPEKGWNYEIGYRIRTKKNALWWDLSLFYYHLRDAIVIRVNENGQEYFINAGGTQQPGIESQLNFDIIQQRDVGAIRQFTLQNSYTYHHFIFKDYRSVVNDYSGNAITGVPRHTSVTGLTLKFFLGFYFFIEHNYTGKIPLNDDSSQFADGYNLMQIKVGWNRLLSSKWEIGLFAGIDNLLNERYSLGNDLNAVGQRYYNAAPVRNYLGGLKILFQ